MEYLSNHFRININPCSAILSYTEASCSDQIHPSNKDTPVVSKCDQLQIIPRQISFIDGGLFHQSNKLPHKTSSSRVRLTDTTDFI